MSSLIIPTKGTPRTEPLRIAIGVPAYGSHLDVGHAGLWLGLGIAIASSPEKFTLGGLATYHVNGIAHCRNLMLYNALRAGNDWLLMVDADTFHHTQETIGDAGIDVLQMIWDAQKQDGAVIGAPVCARRVEHELPVVEIERNGKYELAHPDFFRGRVVPVARLGGAFTAVNLQWIRACWPQGPWFEFVYGLDANQKPVQVVGEDYNFCDKVRERGGTVLCDGRFAPEHVARRRLAGHPITEP